MKIKSIDTKRMFKDLHCGDLFEWKDEIYMKIELSIAVRNNESANSVNLSDGRLAYIAAEHEVKSRDDLCLTNEANIR